MKTLSNKIVSFLAMTAFAFMSVQGYAAGGKISGSGLLTYTKQEALPITEANGNILLLGELHGINKNTGTTNYMEGADVVNREIVQLFQGNGPHSGYFTLSKDGNTVTALWKGEVTTVMASDGTPQTSFKGTWQYVAGSGKFDGIKGHGEYHGHFTAKTSYAVDWSGEYALK